MAAACQRVALLRATVPNQLAQHLTEHLQQCRPASDTPGSHSGADQPAKLDGMSHTANATIADQSRLSSAEPAAGPIHAANNTQEDASGPQTDAVSMTPLSPAPADLQTMYTAAVQRMPALRYTLFILPDIAGCLLIGRVEMPQDVA